MYIMKEDTLTQIKNEVEITKLNIEKNNTMLKRIKELEKNRYVREYLSLVGLSNTKQKFITDTEHNKHYAFDFEYNNKLIEFNGDYWHCNPKQCKEDFYNKSKLLTAKEIWENDKLKIQCAQKNGYDVLVIWESEYNENPHNTLRKCIKFLNNEN